MKKKTDGSSQIDELEKKTKEIEAEKEEKKFAREERKFRKLQEKKQQRMERLIAPVLLILTLLISYFIYWQSSK